MTAGPAGTVTYSDPNHLHAATGQSTVANQYASYDAEGNMTCRNTDTVQSNAGGMNPYAYVGDNPETKTDPTGTYYSTEAGITQHGGAIGYVMPGDDVFTTAINDGSGNDWSLNNQDTWNYGSIDVSTFSREQENAYGSYNPLTDPNNTPAAKFAHLTGWDKLQQTWSNPNATLQDKAAAAGQFALTNLNNAFQLAMIVGGPEGGEEIGVAEEEGSAAIDRIAESCALSFTPATPVATDHGEQAMGTMQVGEKVWAYNSKTQKMELEPVLHVWINHDNDLVDLKLTTTTHAPHSTTVTKTSEVIHTNKKHPFLTKEKGFLPVGQIKLGMHVLRADGSYGIVTGWKIMPGVKAMYNLEVAHDHTFVVGMGEWVVHNCGGGDIPWSSKSVKQAASAIDEGDTEVTVANRSEAEEIFLRKYQGRGYQNTTGLSGPEAKNLFGSKYGTYHWDDNLDPEGGILGHGADNPHGDLPHLQIQPFQDEANQNIIRVFYWP